MKYTGNLNLKKPEGTDIVNINDLNENADILDLAVAGKVDKVAGKGLSDENFTAAEKNKLAGIATGANNYTHPANHPASIITQDVSNRFVTDTEKANWNAKETPAGAQNKVDTHANNTTSAHGATSAATANKIMIRDAFGRAKVAAPSAADDIARKAEVDAVQTNLNAHLSDLAPHGIGNRSTLLTSEKSSIVGAINELFTNAGNGKDYIAAAITGMGQSASGSDTFERLAAKIRDISKDANAAIGDVLSGKTFYQGGSKKTGTMPDNGNVVITPGTINKTIDAGKHGGGGYVVGDPNLIGSNIKSGVSIFGIPGTVIPKTFASGTAITGDKGALVVTGLTFQPTIVILEDPGGGSRQVHNGLTGSSGGNILNGVTYQQSYAYGSGSIIPNANGFSATGASGGSSGRTVNWWAMA